MKLDKFAITKLYRMERIGMEIKLVHICTFVKLKLVFS